LDLALLSQNSAANEEMLYLNGVKTLSLSATGVGFLVQSNGQCGRKHMAEQE
jgi:hypothetical protein